MNTNHVAVYDLVGSLLSLGNVLEWSIDTSSETWFQDPAGNMKKALKLKKYISQLNELKEKTRDFPADLGKFDFAILQAATVKIVGNSITPYHTREQQDEIEQLYKALEKYKRNIEEQKFEVMLYDLSQAIPSLKEEAELIKRELDHESLLEYLSSFKNTIAECDRMYTTLERYVENSLDLTEKYPKLVEQYNDVAEKLVSILNTVEGSDDLLCPARDRLYLDVNEERDLSPDAAPESTDLASCQQLGERRYRELTDILNKALRGRTRKH